MLGARDARLEALSLVVDLREIAATVGITPEAMLVQKAEDEQVELPAPIRVALERAARVMLALGD